MAQENPTELNKPKNAYRALCEVAVERHRHGEYAGSNIMLQNLLLNADLPIIIQAYRHMLLATTNDDEVDFVGHACEP